MEQPVTSLFPDLGIDPVRPAKTGALPAQTIAEFVEAGFIRGAPAVVADQIQPASLDLRLGPKAFRVTTSFLPGGEHKVDQKLPDLRMYELDLSESAVFEQGCVYIVPLMEELHLPRKISGLATPKSSIGRIDVFTRLITDYGAEFERVAAGYRGKLYVEVAPRTFSIIVRAGDRLNQLRLRRGISASTDAKLKKQHSADPLVFWDGAAPDQPTISNGIWVSVDLQGKSKGQPVAYRARKHGPLLDLSKIGHYNPGEYWETIYPERPHRLVLNPDDFYLLASKETIRVPPECTAEMAPYDTTAGEFRAHYAGFFDPGFGCRPDGGAGTCAVLEVRSHDVPFLLEDGQRVGRLVYERLTAVPTKLYGSAIGSSYQYQGLALSKHFRR